MFGARFAVFVRRARVLPRPCHATRNLSFLRVHRHRHPVVSTRNFHWDGTGWYENSTRWKSCKCVQTRARGACYSIPTHGGRNCAESQTMQDGQEVSTFPLLSPLRFKGISGILQMKVLLATKKCLWYFVYHCLPLPSSAGYFIIFEETPPSCHCSPSTLQCRSSVHCRAVL